MASTNLSETSSDDDSPEEFPHGQKRKMQEDVTSSSGSTDDSPPTKKQYISGETDKHNMTDMQKRGNYSNFASNMMAKMGYKAGTGLGKSGQGRVDIVPASQQRGRRGLGLRVKALDVDVTVDWRDEKPPSAHEEVHWIPPYTGDIPDIDELMGWSLDGKRKLKIEDETQFCERQLLQTLLTCKSIFDDLEGFEMRKARTKSNPYELIKGAIFLNRAAMKMANMDYCFDRMFTSPKGLDQNQLLYFADVCAGPGGFSEYVLWRRGWRCKGFGFTLKGGNDFKLRDFFAADPELFEPHYGVGGKDGTGDIMNGENLEEFQRFVLENTDNKGVHFVMADGGFSVEGQENIQEILTKQLLLCQFACALLILRQGGSFVCKTFDLFTPFSVGLIYLLRMAFERVAVFKPVTSRPANSERYVVCEGYRDTQRDIGDYLLNVNERLNELKGTDEDVNEVVPFEILSDDDAFFQYMKKSNEILAEVQCKALAKIHDFTKDSNLIEPTQADIRAACLKLWGIPDRVRSAPVKSDPSAVFSRFLGVASPSAVFTRPPEVVKADNLKLLERVHNYKCIVTTGTNLLILSLGGSYVKFWNTRTSSWSHLTQVTCSLPRATILEVEIVDEIRGEDKGQKRSSALHVVDAYVIAGENVSHLSLDERSKCVSLFVKAINKPSLQYLTPVRAKTFHRLQDVDELFDRLSMRKVKGGGPVPRICCTIPGCPSAFFVPGGVTFVGFAKEPWSLAFSRSQKKLYYFNERTRKSVFDCPPDSVASSKECAANRIFWPWSDQVKVLPEQQHPRPDMLSADQLRTYVKSHVVC